MLHKKGYFLKNVCKKMAVSQIFFERQIFHLYPVAETQSCYKIWLILQFSPVFSKLLAFPGLLIHIKIPSVWDDSQELIPAVSVPLPLSVLCWQKQLLDVGSQQHCWYLVYSIL